MGENNTGITAPTITASINGGTWGALNDGAWAEPTNATGWYTVEVNGTDTAAAGSIMIKAVKTGYDTAYAQLSVLDGTVQTGDAYAYLTTNLGALGANLSTLVTNIWGAGTRTLSAFGFTANANLTQILGSSLTETVGGYLAAAFKKLFDVAAPVLTTASVNQTGDAYAYLGTNLGALGANLSTLVTNIWGAGTRTLTSGGGSLTVNQIWDELTSGHTTAGSFAKLLIDNIDAKITSRSTLAAGAQMDLVNAPNSTALTAIGTQVWATTVRTLSAFGFTVATNSDSNVTAIKTTTDKFAFTKTNQVDANMLSMGGTTQTARDIGANVLLSPGTGAGQLDITSGVVKANMVQILATALTESVGGYLAAAFKKLFDVAAPVLTSASVNQTGDSYAYLGTNLGALGVNATAIATAVWAAGTRTLSAFGFTVATNSDANVTSIKTTTDKFVFTLANKVDANAVALGGTTQTGRDIGASVLLSPGTGTGQLDFTSGVVKANLAQILGTALTETAGYLAAGFKKFFNVAVPVHTVASVDQTGDSYGRIGAAGAGLTALGDTRIGNLDAAVSTRSTLAAGAAMTLTAAYDAAKTAAAAGAKMDLIDAPNSTALTALATSVWGLATRTLSAFSFTVNTNDATNIGLIKAVTDQMRFTIANQIDANALTGGGGGGGGGGATVNQIWDELTSGHNTSGSFAKLLKDYLDAAVSSRSTLGAGAAMTLTSAYDAAKSAAAPGAQMDLVASPNATALSAIGTAVWAAGTRTLTTFGSLASDAATAVWAAGVRTLSAFGFTVTPSNASDTTAIKAKTDQLAFTIAGQVDSNAVTGGTAPAAIWAYGTRTLTEIVGAGDATAANQVAILSALSNIEGAGFDTGSDSLHAIRARGDQAWLTGGIGGGSQSWTYTVTRSDTGDPIAEVRVWVTLDSAGSQIVASGYTDNSGKITFMLDKGTVYVWCTKTGYSFANPDTEVVS